MAKSYHSMTSRRFGIVRCQILLVKKRSIISAFAYRRFAYVHKVWPRESRKMENGQLNKIGGQNVSGNLDQKMRQRIVSYMGISTA